MLFLGIISWKVASRFNGGGGGCFSDGSFTFKLEGAPHGEGFRKILGLGRGAPSFVLINGQLAARGRHGRS